MSLLHQNAAVTFAPPQVMAVPARSDEKRADERAASAQTCWPPAPPNGGRCA